MNAFLLVFLVLHFLVALWHAIRLALDNPLPLFGLLISIGFVIVISVLLLGS